MIWIRPPALLRLLSPQHLLCQVPTREKILYLTFDDGPITGLTEEVLDILHPTGARGTFFMVGDNVRKHPEVYKRVVEQGHQAGNHTFHHLNGWKTSPGAYIDDVERCSMLFPGRLFRPPYGRITPSQFLLLKNRYRIVLWSLLSNDFNPAVTPEQCLAIVLQHAVAGSVVVFHDNPKAEKKVLYALPRVLDHFGGLGYRFETIGTGYPSSLLSEKL